MIFACVWFKLFSKLRLFFLWIVCHAWVLIETPIVYCSWITIHCIIYVFIYNQINTKCNQHFVVIMQTLTMLWQENQKSENNKTERRTYDLVMVKCHIIRQFMTCERLLCIKVVIYVKSPILCFFYKNKVYLFKKNNYFEKIFCVCLMFRKLILKNWISSCQNESITKQIV